MSAGRRPAQIALDLAHVLFQIGQRGAQFAQRADDRRGRHVLLLEDVEFTAARLIAPLTRR
jgi:hypothetical protein